MDDDYPRARRGGGPGLGTVIVVSALTSAAATVLTLFAIARFHLPVPLPAAPIATAPAAAAPGGATDAARAGEEDFVLPNLARVPVESARSLLGTLHLRLSVRGLRADPAVPADSVIEQSPASGARVRRGEIVEVVVSTGPASPPADATAVALTDASADAPSELVEVPQLVGQRFTRARTLLEQTGLTLGRRREGDDPDRSAYVVLSQSIPRGTRVARGTAIDLVVNSAE